MTRNIIRRPHDDPAWSGHLVEGANAGWDSDECNTSHLLEHLDRAVTLACAMSVDERVVPSLDNHGVIAASDYSHRNSPLYNHTLLAELFETVDNLQRYLPWIDGYCVVQYLGVGDNRTPYVLSAHLTYRHAETWLEWWDVQKTPRPHHPRYAPRFGIERMPAPILAFRHEDAEPGRGQEKGTLA